MFIFFPTFDTFLLFIYYLVSMALAEPLECSITPFPILQAPGLQKKTALTCMGSWTMVLNNSAESLQFSSKLWSDYREGFTSANGLFYIGNEMLNYLTSNKLHKLRIDAYDAVGEFHYAEMETVSVESETKGGKISSTRLTFKLYTVLLLLYLFLIDSFWYLIMYCLV